jgi:hypothetical protein
MLPPPGPHLQIEHDMVPILWQCGVPHEGTHGDKCKKKSGLAMAPLTAAGIPVVGRIDLMHDLGTNYGAEGPEDTQDPEGTIEVFDHKFTKDLRYALKGTDMVKNIQMVAYGEYVFRTVPGVQQVRLSHGYYPTNGNAVKRTIRVGREPISRYWVEHVEPLARSIAEAAKETNPDNVKANTKACQAFGRPCMHAEYCSAGMQLGLQAQVGGTAAQALVNILRKPKDPDSMPVTPGKGLLAHIKKTPAADTAAREAELAKLKAEEEAAKKNAYPDWLFGTIQSIETIAQKNNLGWPALKGKAQDAYLALAGQVRDAVGALEGVELSDVEEFKTLLAELTDAYGEIPADETPPAPVDLLPDDAPVIETPPPTTNPLAAVAAEAEKPKAKRTRGPNKPKVIETTATETKAELTTPSGEAVPVIRDENPKADAAYVEQIKSSPEPTPAKEGTKVHLFVDVSIDGAQFVDFASMVDTLTDAMAKRFGLDDVRVGGPDSPLGYGKWKGVLSAAIRETDIPAGTYYIDARGSEIYEEAVQALRQVVKRTGGVYVRGSR